MSEPRPLPYDWKDVRARLQGRVGGLVRRLGVTDKEIHGRLATPLNPRRADRHRGSFVIWLDKGREGAWRDYASGDAGDIFDLIMAFEGLAAKIDAYWWALEFLGLGRGEVRTADQAQRDRERARLERAADEARAAAAAAETSAKLFAQWLALPPIAGTVAETYLREARRLPLHRLARQPGALRFAEQLRHIDDETGEITEWPAMVSAMTRGSDLVALHRTWLQPDGAGKAAVAKPKKMVGSPKGAAIHLSRGPGSLSPAAAARAGKSAPLAVGEGIETCLTVACARPDYRVWAAGSLSLMGLVDWPPCASAVVLLGENDWSPQAREAFARVRAHWEAQSAGRPVVVAASAVGSDFNSWLMENAR